MRAPSAPTRQSVPGAQGPVAGPLGTAYGTQRFLMVFAARAAENMQNGWSEMHSETLTAWEGTKVALYPFSAETEQSSVGTAVQRSSLLQ